MKKLRKIHNTDYYKAEFIMADPKFIKFVDTLIKTFSKFGCPIPAKGFKSYKEYLKWNDKYFDSRSNIEYSEEFKNKIDKITGGKDSWGDKEQSKIEKLQHEELPPVYGSAIEDLLRRYDIGRKDKNYRRFKDFIIEYIFFNKREFTNTPLIITWKRNEKTREAELFIKILPHTRKEDLEKLWPIIKEEQASLPKYKVKHKEYKNFHRDLEIYNIYKNFRKKPTSKYKRDKCWYNERTDHETEKVIGEKYGISSWGTIRAIVGNIEKLKKSVGFKDTP